MAKGAPRKEIVPWYCFAFQGKISVKSAMLSRSKVWTWQEKAGVSAPAKRDLIPTGKRKRGVAVMAACRMLREGGLWVKAKRSG